MSDLRRLEREAGGRRRHRLEEASMTRLQRLTSRSPLRENTTRLSRRGGDAFALPPYRMPIIPAERRDKRWRPISIRLTSSNCRARVRGGARIVRRSWSPQTTDKSFGRLPGARYLQTGGDCARYCATAFPEHKAAGQRAGVPPRAESLPFRHCDLGGLCQRRRRETSNVPTQKPSPEMARLACGMWRGRARSHCC